MKYIIEHMDNEMHKWSIIEYKHISSIVGKNNLIFTNVKKGADKIKDLGKIREKSITEMNFEKICILDSDSKHVLKTSDKQKFDYFVFGGILGDNPPQKRTQNLIKSLKFPTRNLGDKQMSTDTAVLAVKMILSGKKLSEIEFADTIIIPIREDEEVILPFRYILQDGKLMLAPGIVKMLKEQKGF
ncbi:hypothetical protein KY304_00290 [Candidatus Woesearchaeota archaeon]|nr:hypothetical protein [Candidatus Woesearchaeota archaeon]